MPTLQILLHSSKTMIPTNGRHIKDLPRFSAEAAELRQYMQTLSSAEIAHIMKVSPAKASAVQTMYATTHDISPAAECFRGDIYSGLRALEFTASEREFAQKHLLILSGMYGVLRPYDGIEPYRLEAAYRLPDTRYANIYAYWAERIKQYIDPSATIIHLTSLEYEKLLAGYLPDSYIQPQFLTRKHAAAEPEFVTVHTKIARGAFARWIITKQAENPDITAFADLGYHYDPIRSTPTRPVYICDDFGGIGLSQRLR